MYAFSQLYQSATSSEKYMTQILWILLFSLQILQMLIIHYSTFYLSWHDRNIKGYLWKCSFIAKFEICHNFFFF